MSATKQILLWLALAFACFVPASALTPTAPENSIWEIFNIGYDAPTVEATDLANRTETPISNYDTAPIHRAITEAIPTAANRSLFGPNAEFKAAEEGGGTLVNLNKQLASEAQSAELNAGKGEAMAGAGTSTPIRDVQRLQSQYGGDAADWAKIRSSNYKASDGTSFETHAYQNVKTGQVVELKTKFQ